jgi:hypothetical protein
LLFLNIRTSFVMEIRINKGWRCQPFFLQAMPTLLDQLF